MAMIHLAISIPLFIIGSALVIYSVFGEGFSPGLEDISRMCNDPDRRCDPQYITTLYAELLIGISMIITGIFFAAKTTSEPTQQKPEESNKEMKGKTLEEYKIDYLTKKKNYQPSKETADTDERLFLEIQKKLNKLMLKKDYSLSESVKIVAEDYNKLGINLTVDRSGNAFKINGTLSDEKMTESYTDQKPTKKKEITTFCENCGKILKPEVKFCGNCGTKV